MIHYIMLSAKLQMRRRMKAGQSLRHQKSHSPPEGEGMTLSANERVTEILNDAISVGRGERISI
jgi:hypothetical protein